VVAVGTTGEVEDDEVTEDAGVLEDGVVVVLPMAAAWKAANLSPGLMAKTMPLWQ